MKIIIAGGTGQVGTMLARRFHDRGDEVTVLSRKPTETVWPSIIWDAETLGEWNREIDGADIVINLAGRNVNCRYTNANRQQILNSRVRSTLVIGEAISKAKSPPKLWLQASTATIYSHRFDAANDDTSGIIGGNEPDAPDSWKFSIEVARAWEKAANEANTPNTRKVLMRSAVVLSPDRDGIFDILLGLVRRGLGGTAGNGRQYVSWIHDHDFIRSIDFLIAREEIAGTINLSAPNPLPNREFMRILREVRGTRIGLPATKLMLSLGAVFMGTETELVLKSRRVVPSLLLELGFEFEFSHWPDAAKNLCERWRNSVERL